MVTLDIAYWEHPGQVIWVDLPHRRLQGFDHYWVDWPRYGMWNTTDQYEGLEAVAWEYDGEERSIIASPSGRVFDGYMLTTAQARFVGLL